MGHHSEAADRTVDTHIKTLRAKLRDASPALDAIVRALLPLALSILLANALNHAPPDVELTFELCGMAGGTTPWSLRDRGPGVPAAGAASAQAAGATMAPWMLWRFRASATKPLALARST